MKPREPVTQVKLCIAATRRPQQDSPAAALPAALKLGRLRGGGLDRALRESLLCSPPETEASPGEAAAPSFLGPRRHEAELRLRPHRHDGERVGGALKMQLTKEKPWQQTLNLFEGGGTPSPVPLL